MDTDLILGYKTSSNQHLFLTAKEARKYRNKLYSQNAPKTERSSYFQEQIHQKNPNSPNTFSYSKKKQAVQLPPLRQMGTNQQPVKIYVPSFKENNCILQQNTYTQQTAQEAQKQQQKRQIKSAYCKPMSSGVFMNMLEVMKNKATLQIQNTQQNQEEEYQLKNPSQEEEMK